MAEEKTINVGEEAEEEKRIMLSTGCAVNEFPKITYEIEIPEIVLVELGMSFIKGNDKIQFIKENGRVYVEKS